MIVPMTVAPMSCVASATIMFMILRSKKKLKDPYRRIIFCMSMYDIFSSLPVALRPFKVLLTSSGHSSLALGTQASCDLLTYIQIVGVVGTPMYSLSLNIYYLFVIKYRMRERHFRRKVEPFIHIIPALWTLGGATFALFSKMFNPGKSNIFLDCWLNCLLYKGIHLNLNGILQQGPLEGVFLHLNLWVAKRMMILNVKEAKMHLDFFYSLERFL
jgi:hypothetical protein